MKKSVAIRKLKSHLSEYLEKVRRGEVVYVANRGKVIAEIRPVNYNEEKAALLELDHSGLLSWNGLKPLGTLKPIPHDKKSIEDYISEGRR